MTNEALRIMVVDDSSMIRKSMGDQLETLGYIVHLTGSAEQAQQLIKRLSLDIIFLDLMLPGIQGLEYLEQLHKDNENIIVIVMTGNETPGTAISAIEKGAYDYLIKPIKSIHLELIIRRALKRYQIDQERQNAINKRIEALGNYANDCREMRVLINDLKMEVNNLLEELERNKKYVIH